MSHDLELTEDGTYAMAYAGPTPWHSHGTPVDDVMTAREAMVLAKLDWEVRLQPIFTQVLLPGGRTENVNIAHRRAVVRSTDNKVLSVVSDKYKPIQNVESFQYFDDIVDSGEAKYETAGALSGGQRIWMTAKIGEEIQIAGQDPHNMYLLLVNSHDGTKALTAAITLIRVVCANTETLALNTASSTFTLNHRKALAGRTAEARDALGMSFKYVEAYEAEVQKMISKQITKDKFAEIIRGILPEQSEETTNAKVNTFVNLFESSPSIVDAGGAGNVWGAFNAVTQFESHKSMQTEEARFQSNIFGLGRKFRQDVQKQLMAV